jgi:hydrolase, NUDIX family
MYTVFFDDKKILVTNTLKKSYKRKYRIFTLKDLSVEAFIKKIDGYRSGKFLFYIDSPDPLKDFEKAFTLIQAGGGVVRNPKGRILFIKRRGKWDLPKGKLEKGEVINQCAQREVEEETGVKGLRVLGKRVVTYHIYKQDQHWCLKQTHWYNMYSDSQEELHPQEEEDIEICAWKKPKKLKKLLKNSFSSLKEVFKGEY